MLLTSDRLCCDIADFRKISLSSCHLRTGFDMMMLTSSRFRLDVANFRQVSL